MMNRCQTLLSIATCVPLQRYALLGNSLSVACVAPLIDYLLTDA